MKKTDYKKTRFVLSILIFLFVINAKSQTITDSVKWISLEEAGAEFLEVQKPVIFYFYKDDCDSCRYMEETTFSNSEVSNYINILFYPVKINALSKDTIKFFDGKLYANSEKTGKIHDLAYMLGVHSDTLPSLVFFSRKAQGIEFPGYKNRDEIFRILTYYNEGIYDYVEFEDWYKYHRKGYPPGQSQIMTRLLVKWKTLDEALELNKTQKRKIILNLYNYNRVSCTLMRTNTFNQPQVADYINKNFYPISIDVFTKDTLEIFGQKYINENQPYKYHQLPIAALEGKMNFPVFLILDENLKVLEKVTGYLTPEMVESILNFYGSNSNKTIKWQIYKKEFVSKIKEE